VQAAVALIDESDIPDVAAFLARQTRPGEAIVSNLMAPERRLRWLLLENPCRSNDIPLGWKIRNETGVVVGAAICIPFHVGAGEFSAVALMFAKFFVDPDYRGMGLGIFMRFVREGRRFPLFCASTNAKSGELFSRMGGTIIPGMDHTMLGIRRPKPLIEEWIYRRTGRPALAKILSIPAVLAPGRNSQRRRNGSAELRRLQNIDEIAAVGLSTTANILGVVRDRDYLQWRYLSGERATDIYSFRNGGDVARLVVVEEIRSGHRGQIRVLNILDIFPPTNAESAPLLASALAAQYEIRFDVIWFRSQPPDAENALHAAGFVRHTFPAPLGWVIDAANRLPTKQWYLMPGESE
jgi:GNAT superfamily N-acetyltransferase